MGPLVGDSGYSPTTRPGSLEEQILDQAQTAEKGSGWERGQEGKEMGKLRQREAPEAKSGGAGH